MLYWVLWGYSCVLRAFLKKENNPGVYARAGCVFFR
jgi:hypothetical protein